MGTVAVIDIGSNSIKSLVAAVEPGGALRTLFSQTLDARISAGISRAKPELGEDGMRRGVEATRALLAALAPYPVTRVTVVATSAVRDAANGDAFRERIRAATGHPVRILTGTEEANYIGRGLACDPALRSPRDFYVFDLGGGSLECLAFRNRQIEQGLSLQLGCVRLTERLVPKPEAPLAQEQAEAVRETVQATLRDSGFRFDLPPGATAVGTGGTITTARAIWAARAGKPLEETGPLVPVDGLRALAAELSALPLAARQQVPGLPPGRADVYPVALLTLAALAGLGGFTAYRHSFYNLRYGLAAEALGLG